MKDVFLGLLILAGAMIALITLLNFAREWRMEDGHSLASKQISLEEFKVETAKNAEIEIAGITASYKVEIERVYWQGVWNFVHYIGTALEKIGAVIDNLFDSEEQQLQRLKRR